MASKLIYSDFRALNEAFGVEHEGPDGEWVECFTDSSFFNPMQGRKHSEESILLMKEIAKDPVVRAARTHYGEKNGMYGSARFGDLNPMWGRKHSPETLERMRNTARTRTRAKGWKRSEKSVADMADRNSKTFTLRNPEGEIVQIKNLEKFARENGLNPVMLSRVARGKAGNHKGWTTP